jgi:hypothetical protein
MSEELDRRRRARAEFLRRLYHRVDASVTEFVNGLEVGTELGLDEDETRKLFAYHEEKGFVRVDDHRSGMLRITAAGIDHVESTD